VIDVPNEQVSLEQSRKHFDADLRFVRRIENPYGITIETIVNLLKTIDFDEVSIQKKCFMKDIKILLIGGNGSLDKVCKMSFLKNNDP
jgi:hypothetical protein